VFAGQELKSTLDQRVIIPGRQGLLQGRVGNRGRNGFGGGNGRLRGRKEVRQDAQDAPKNLVGAGGAVASSTELGNMSCCSTSGATAVESVSVGQHPLVCCAIIIH
jgi:hypothetical protein